MAKQLHITITINDAEHGYDASEELDEAMYQISAWLYRGRSARKVVQVYSEDNRRVGRIVAEFVEVPSK